MTRTILFAVLATLSLTAVSANAAQWPKFDGVEGEIHAPTNGSSTNDRAGTSGGLTSGKR